MWLFSKSTGQISGGSVNLQHRFLLWITVCLPHHVCHFHEISATINQSTTLISSALYTVGRRNVMFPGLFGTDTAECNSQMRPWSLFHWVFGASESHLWVKSHVSGVQVKPFQLLGVHVLHLWDVYLSWISNIWGAGQNKVSGVWIQGHINTYTGFSENKKS